MSEPEAGANVQPKLVLERVKSTENLSSIPQSANDSVTEKPKSKRGRKKKSDTILSVSDSKIVKPSDSEKTLDSADKENTNPTSEIENAKKPDKPSKVAKLPKTEKVPKAPKEPKLPKGTILESDVLKVYDYVKSQNRPYSVADIFTNMRKAIGKTNLIRIMDQLELDGKVVSKTPSKTKIYLISQDEFVPIEDGAIDNLNSSIVEKTELLDQKRAQFDNIKEKTKSVASLAKSIGQRRDLEAELEATKRIVEELKVQQGNIDLDEVAKNKEKALSYYKIWKSRRSKCEEIMNAILDAYDKPKKVLKEAAEIEDDPQMPPKIPFT